jgi:hypothetical protein
MSFGLCGASGTGKSTLAKEISETMGIPYHDASTTRIMKAAGFNPVNFTWSLDARLDAQEFLLKKFTEEVSRLPRPFITDRTPIDMLAYTLGELTMLNATPEQGSRAYRYASDCMETTVNLFSAVLVLRPLPSYEATDTRPPPNKAYQLQTQLLMEGAVHQAADVSNLSWAQMYTHHRKARLDCAVEFFVKYLSTEVEMAKQVGVH